MEKGDIEKALKAKSQMEQYRINYDTPVLVGLGKKQKKIFPMKGKVSDAMSVCFSMQEKYSEAPETGELVVKISINAKKQFKALSLALLNHSNGFVTFMRVNLFHWLHYRLIMWKYTSADVFDVLNFLIEKMGAGFFFQNTALSVGLNTLTKKMTKEEVESKSAEQE